MSSHKETELYYTDKIQQIQQTMPYYVRQYIRSIHNRTAPRTRYEYLKDIDKLLAYLRNLFQEDDITLDHLNRLTKTDFEEYFEHLEHYKKNGKDVTNSRTSIKRKMSSIRRLFSYLFTNGLLPSDETEKLELPKLHKKNIIRLDNAEADRFLETVETGFGMTKKEADYYAKQSVRDKAIVYLFLSTGLRVSECAELDLSDIDMQKHCLTIIRKGGNESTVYFSDEAAPYLQEYLDKREADQPADEKEQALFLSSRKTRLCTRSIENIIKKYAKRAVLSKKITPHKLRATYATNLYHETGDIYLVAETLGHNDVTTTKEHYADMSEQRKEEHRNAVTFRKKESP